MPTLLLGITNRSGDDIAVGPPTALDGDELMAVAPDPVVSGTTSAGMIAELPGQDEVAVTYSAQVLVNPPVTLTIDIWIRRHTFEKLIVGSSDPVGFPIEGKYTKEGPDAFAAVLTVG